MMTEEQESQFIEEINQWWEENMNFYNVDIPFDKEAEYLDDLKSLMNGTDGDCTGIEDLRKKLVEKFGQEIVTNCEDLMMSRLSELAKSAYEEFLPFYEKSEKKTIEVNEDRLLSFVEFCKSIQK